MNKIITIYAREVSTKEGKKFTAFETTDKNGNKVNIAFALNGKAAPNGKDCPLLIEIIEAKRDKRKFFPTVRIYDYSVIGKPEVVQDNLDDLF